MEGGKQFSVEIQGLRAIAVLSVLFFHIWPTRMPGGYVGVDVFFVISGYLITGVLRRELDATGTISIAGFYQRRIKRLLPAATVTILGVAVAFRLQPVVTWAASAKSMVASTLYAQNWWLAHQATDYWAQDNAPGALRHFWSLAVEEQFYIIWPLLLLLSARLARRLRRPPESLMRAAILVVGVMSLAYCIALSRTSPTLAYFATTTRAWELALGGALAAWPRFSRLSPTTSTTFSNIGLTMIVAACFIFDEETRFPGSAALLPTLGAAAVIAAGTVSSPWSLARLLRTRAAQFYGDISYSLYLWHWPVLIFYRDITDSRMTIADGLIVFALAGALAHQTKILIEDPFRRRGAFDRRRWHTFGFALVCMASTLAAAGWVDRAHTRKLRSAHTQELRKAQIPVAAPARLGEFDTLNEEDRVLAALSAQDDIAPWYRSKCRGYQATIEPVPCEHGSKDGDFAVTLIGDSHAVHWEPAFIELARQKSWNFSMYAKTMCSMGDHSVTTGKERVFYESCDTYRANVIARLKRDKPDLVIISQSSNHRPLHVDDKQRARVVAESLERTVRSLEAVGIHVLLMADTPWLRRPGPECLSDPQYTPGSCDLSMTRVKKRVDPVLLLGAAHPDVGIVKMNKYLCDEKTCKVIIDGMIVFKDSHHLTATFSTSLAARLGAEISRFLP